MAMLPEERSLVEVFKDKPFAIVGVNSDPKEKLQKMVKDEEVTWRNFTNDKPDGGTISSDWRVVAWPSLYIIDHKGVIRHKAGEGLHGESLVKAIQALVDEVE